MRNRSVIMNRFAFCTGGKRSTQSQGVKESRSLLSLQSYDLLERFKRGHGVHVPVFMVIVGIFFTVFYTACTHYLSQLFNFVFDG